MSAILLMGALSGNFDIPVPAMVFAFILFAFIQWIKRKCRVFLRRSREK